MDNTNQAIIRACEAPRSQAALAKTLGVTPPVVNQWIQGLRPVPLDHCPAIQEFTGGAVTCEEIRPDKTEYFSLIRSQATHHCTEQVAV
jgi:DNA-binding transcriptional regulator YdaS (Cro superfamily)